MSERATRVGERIREDLMELLLRGEIKDPAVRGVVVHEVRVSGDLRHARIYVRLTEPDADERRKRRLLAGLARARGYMRKQLGARLGIRYTPELAFYWDDTAERANRVEQLLDEVRSEPAPGGREGDADEGEGGEGDGREEP